MDPQEQDPSYKDPTRGHPKFWKLPYRHLTRSEAQRQMLFSLLCPGLTPNGPARQAQNRIGLSADSYQAETRDLPFSAISLRYMVRIYQTPSICRHLLGFAFAVKALPRGFGVCHLDFYACSDDVSQELEQHKDCHSCVERHRQSTAAEKLSKPSPLQIWMLLRRLPAPTLNYFCHLTIRVARCQLSSSESGTQNLRSNGGLSAPGGAGLVKDLIQSLRTSDRKNEYHVHACILCSQAHAHTPMSSRWSLELLHSLTSSGHIPMQGFIKQIAWGRERITGWRCFATRVPPHS